MINAAIIELIEEKLKTVEAHGFGEVVVKIKNGAVYRILVMTDTIVKHDIKPFLTNIADSDRT